MSTAPVVTTPPVSAARRPGEGRARWRRARIALIILGAIGAVLLTLVLVDGPDDREPLSPRNSQPDGARALANVLDKQGVTVIYTTSLNRALAADAATTQVLVIDPGQLEDSQLDRLRELEADLVLAGDLWQAVDTLSAQQLTLGSTWGQTSASSPASCAAREAQQAQRLDPMGGYDLLEAGENKPDNVTFCFPDSDEGADSGQYAIYKEGHEVRVIANGSVLMNGAITKEGNAALALGALGRKPNLVWYMAPAQGFDLGGDSAGSMFDLLPPWAGGAAGVLLFAGLLAAIARGRRFGRLVREPLPVEVRAAETAYGRGRLYRSSRANGHAGAALRAGTVSRLAARLGLPRAATPLQVVAATVQASGRPGAEIHDLLYGGPPASAAELLKLATALDRLEREVTRP